MENNYRNNKLEKGFGFAFTKYVDLNELVNFNFSDLTRNIQYAYDYVVKNEDEFDEKEFLNSNPLCGSLISLFTSKRDFNVVGQTNELNQWETKIPEFKFWLKPYHNQYLYEEYAEEWSSISIYPTMKYYPKKYEQVKHLNSKAGLSPEYVSRRITMELIRKRGEKIEDYYDLEIWEEKSINSNVIHTTPFYEVPNKYKNIAK